MFPTKFLFILAKGFERRKLNCENLTDNGRQVMAIAHIAFGKVNLKKPKQYKTTANYFESNK